MLRVLQRAAVDKAAGPGLTIRRMRQRPGSFSAIAQSRRIIAVLAMSAALPCGTVLRAFRSAAADQLRSRSFNLSNRRTRPPIVVTLRSSRRLHSATTSCVHCAYGQAHEA